MQIPLNPYIRPVGMLALVYLGCLMFILFTIKHKKFPSVIFKVIAFVICAIMSTLINGQYTDDNLLMTIIELVLWVIALIVFYIIAKENKTSLKPFYIISFALPFMAYLFYRIYQVDVNSVYYVLLFLPFILTIKQTYIKGFGVLMIYGSVILSLKRTALIAAVASILVYFFSSLFMAKEQHKIKTTIQTLSLLLIISIGGFFLYDYLNNYYDLNWILRMQSLKTDGGSDRDVIWMTTIYMQFKSTAAEWFFGHGSNAVLRDSPLNLTAHNDFLEVLYDYGVVTFTLYIGFIYSLIKTMVGMYKRRFSLAAQYSSTLPIFLIMSTTSHLVIYPTYFIYLAFFWGLSIAQYENYTTMLMNGSNVKVRQDPRGMIS